MVFRGSGTPSKAVQDGVSLDRLDRTATTTPISEANDVNIEMEWIYAHAP